MAVPIINNISIVYPGGLSYKLPGQAATLIVDAVDSDNLQIEVQVTVRDAAGNPTSQNAMVIQNDPLTYEGVALSPPGHTVTPGAQVNELIVI